MKKLSTLGIVILIIGIMAFVICDIIVPKNLSELKKDPLTGENAKNYYGLCQALSAIPPFVYCVGALLSISGFIKGQKAQKTSAVGIVGLVFAIVAAGAYVLYDVFGIMGTEYFYM